jgi:hypothetical protein
MHKTASRKIGISLIGLIFLAGAATLTPSLCGAGMHELSDPDMAAVYAQGFSTFSLNGDIVKLDFSGVTLSTWTEIGEMAMGYWNNGTSTAWDNDWKGVNLGSASLDGSKDLKAVGLYIEAGFSGNMSDAKNRQLEYVRIGTTNLTGDISANFVSFSGTIDAGIKVNGVALGSAFTGTRDTTTLTNPSTITAAADGFYLALDRTGSSNQMGFSFHWVKN